MKKVVIGAVLAIVLGAAVYMFRPRGVDQTGQDASAGDSPEAQETEALPLTVRDRIFEALRTNRIDYETSLLYRAYAMSGDPRLPEEFVKEASAAEDRAFFHEVRVNAARISTGTMTRLRPFLVRPTDPESIYNAPRPQAFWDRIVPTLHAASPASCAGQWKDKSAASGQLRIWACADSQAALDDTVRIFDDGLWSRMTALMGNPRWDEGGVLGGGDAAIDIYLVPYDTIAPHGRLASTEGAEGTAPATNIDGPVASGFIVIKTPRVNNLLDLEATLAHEFFHVLQSAHNHPISFVRDPLNNAWVEFWFTEASATWAEWFFVPEASAQEVHYRFARHFQRTRRRSLHSAEPQLFTYSSYIWFFFMEQERRTGQPIATIWRNLEDAGEDWRRALDVIDVELTFDRNFRVFALRNLNDSYGGLFHAEQMYSALDRRFPAGAKPALWQPAGDNNIVRSSVPRPFPILPLPGLRAAYARFNITDEGIRRLRFDFSTLRRSGNLDIDALVRLDDGTTWRLIPIPRGESELKLCLDAIRTDRVELVLSNYSKSIGDVIRGAINVEASADPCACGRVEVVDDRSWIDRGMLTVPGATGQNSSNETSTARFVIELDDKGRVTSSGTSTLHITKSASGHAPPAAPASRDEQLIETARVAGPGGTLDVGPIQPDGSYVIEACTGPVDKTTATTITSSKAGESRSESQTSRDEGGVCARVEGKTAPGTSNLSGTHREPAKVRNSSAGGTSYSGRSPSGVVSGSAGGNWTVSWAIAACAPRQR